MTTALVTGATGCVGANIVEALLAHGYEVRAMRRATSSLDALVGLTPEFVVGDVLDYDSLVSAMVGCELVIHTAAISQYWRNAPDMLYTVNVRGTRYTLQAAMATGVDRVVFTSSVAALGVPRHTGHVLDESDHFNWHPKRFHYGHSKVLAEAEVRRAREKGLDVVCVNPATVIGRRDVNFVGGAILRASRRGWTWVAPPGGMGVVSGEAVGVGHVLAAERGVDGERYVLNGENIAHRDLLALVGAVVGGPKPVFTIPRPIARLGVLLGRLGLTSGGSNRRLPMMFAQALMQLDLSTRYMYFNGRRAERELGVPRIGARAAVREAWDWYREQGLL
ncbi:MAG: NAD-dependent epimerase/dehydratase family protein [Anaerolineae bacterium]